MKILIIIAIVYKKKFKFINFSSEMLALVNASKDVNLFFFLIYLGKCCL